MAGVFGRMMNAIQAGYAVARRVFEDPASAYQQQTFQNQAAQYALLWAYYNNSMFEKLPWSSSWGSTLTGNAWQTYKSNYNLYRNIRMVYNPTRRLVDFYASQVYPGVLSEDGSKLPEGVPLAIPFAEDTPPALRSAIAQLWTWSGWQSKKAVEIRYGAALGSVLVEVVDDIEHGKVCLDIVWPGFIHGLELDSAGNVKGYAIEYQAHDETGPYTYRKEVDDEAIRYYRNNQPYAYSDAGPEIPNIYGFVPAVWIKHIDVGGEHGSPAIAGGFAKIDELNSLASHIHDQIHKIIGAPLVIFGSGPVANLFGTAKRGASASDLSEPAQEQESLLMLKGPADGSVASLAGSLSLADSAQYMDKLLGEIEQDHPELVFYKELRSMSQVTGPAASRLVGDVANRVGEASAAYDRGNIALFQMAVAIAGERARSGAWGPLNRQQAKFTPFDLNSYRRGDLDIAIMPRPLLTPTKLEHAQEQQAMWTGVKFAAAAGMPLELILRDEGWTEDQIAELTQIKESKAQQTLQLMQASQPSPQPGQPQMQQQDQSNQSMSMPMGSGNT